MSEVIGEGAPSSEFNTAGAARRPREADAPALRAPIVGIGASAGGLDAFTRLVRNLKDGTGMAYVLVQHLDPQHESQLAEILDRVAPLPVISAADRMAIEPDHIYVIPSGAAMTVTDGHLHVVSREREVGSHTVIDSFLESLSLIHGSDAVGIILSGAGSDGARGIEAIKERGGITIVQEPDTAQFASMPESALATGCVDIVLPPEQIAEQLVQIAQLSADRRAGNAPGVSNALEIEQILLLVRNRTGVDFRHYRPGTVQRRLQRRMLARRSQGPGDYLAALRADPAELDLLSEDILIGVTHFFRDAEAFAALSAIGLPEITSARPAEGPLRIWIAGCSGGEEAYSVAITALEYLEKHGRDSGLQVFATDLNDAAIARARAALYPLTIEQEVSADRLQRWFVREEGGFRIGRRVRDLCVFARHNLVQDPPFSGLDLITCRNVLIYFDAQLQRRAMEVFHYALHPHGVLMLGAAESAGQEYFVPLDKRHRLYRPQARARRFLDLALRSFPSPPATRASTRGQVVASPHSIQQDADRVVLARFAPPGVVVDADLEVVQFRGDTTRYLHHAPGVASLGLLRIARPELLPALRAAVEQASVDARAVRSETIVMRDDDVLHRVAIEVVPFASGAARERHFVVLFDEAAPSLAEEVPEAPAAAPRASPDAGADAGWELARLNEELAESKRYLQDIIEQYEATNEELRAANEEVQSSNEELRSANEELETTKEEVQSTNEEIETVNEELRHRNRELAAASSDLANFFASTQIPIVIVDSALMIRRFTPAIDRVMKLIATDVGRPLSDIRARFELADLEACVASTIATLEVSQQDIRDEAGRWWTLTIRPYLTVDRKIDGAVLVFGDIDATKKFGEQAVLTSEGHRLLLEETERARAEATTANLAKMHFLANMSHDLRTPLNAISGYADLMELRVHGPLTPDQETDVARIKRSARHLVSLINDILNFAKVETGRIDLRVTAIPIREALQALEETIHPIVQAKGLRLEVEPCDGAILADRDKLQQILINLATNAIKFTASGGVTVRGVLSASSAIVEVTDTGVGIPADQLERIFEPFIQITRSLTSGQPEGVGLGLSISRALARAMGGEITVRSVVGRGSTFSLRLPRGV